MNQNKSHLNGKQNLLNTLYILSEGKAGNWMADLLVENMILSTDLNQSLELEKINKIFSDSLFEPDNLPAIVVHYHNPTRVVFITTEGKLMCTGSKSEEEAKQALKETLETLKENDFIKKSSRISPKIESLVLLKKMNISLPLSQIKDAFPFDRCTYMPSTHPWLEYHQEKYSLLLFSYGDIICTGKISLEEGKEAFDKIEDTLTSIGCNVT